MSKTKERPKTHVMFENLPFPAWRDGKPNKLARKARKIQKG